MKGVRLLDGASDWPPPEGAYWRMDDGTWYAVTPNGMYCNLRNHSVVLHEDGTITVSPSILVTQRCSDDIRQWHGFLEKGEWREA